MTLPAAQVSGKMVCAKPEKECPKVSSCNCCGNFTCFSALLYVGWEIQEKRNKAQNKHNTWDPHMGRKNYHINLGEIGMERFWVNKWMVNESVFLLKGPIIRADLALQSLLPEKYSRIISRRTFIKGQKPSNHGSMKWLQERGMKPTP